MTPILIFIAILIAWVAVNWFVIDKMRITPNHLIFAAIRSVFLLINAMVFYGWPEWGWFFAAELAMWGFPFNILLNTWRGKSLLYLGEKPKTDGEDYSKWDHLAHIWPDAYWAFLLLMVGAGVYLIYTFV